MRVVAAAIILSFVGFSADAADACKVQAAEKKLAGAAMTSFLKKCEKDAATACDVSAKEKKLAGAAKTSFHKKVRQRCDRDVARQALFPSSGASVLPSANGTSRSSSAYSPALRRATWS